MSFVISNKRQCYRHTKTNNLLIKDAAELCHKNGDKLPIPQSQEEHDLFINMLKNNGLKNFDFPIDLQLNNFNTYVMSNGKEPTWTKWLTSQPDFGGKREFVTTFSIYGLWTDAFQHKPMSDYVCQQVCSSGISTLSDTFILLNLRRRTWYSSRMHTYSRETNRFRLQDLLCLQTSKQTFPIRCNQKM